MKNQMQCKHLKNAFEASEQTPIIYICIMYYIEEEEEEKNVYKCMR